MTPDAQDVGGNDQQGWSQSARRRGAVAVVDLAAVTHNTARMLAAAGGAAVMAVVKADAYGHGLVPCALAAQRGGATWLGTALFEEALRLRDAGVGGPILAWLSGPGADWDAVLARGIDVSVSAPWALPELTAAAGRVGRPARVHLKVDTGLSRAGSQPTDWPDLVTAAAQAQALGAVEVVGLWSHLACADTPEHPANSTALQRFHDAYGQATAAGLTPQVRHLANSAATLALPDTRLDLVRPGIALYGISPGEQIGTVRALGLRAAMSLRARLALVKRVPAGQGVSYGHAYVTDRETVLGLVPLGYGDGIARSAANRGPVQAGLLRTSVVGQVCMDQVVVDLGPGSAARIGDEVVLFGDAGTGVPEVEDWGRATGTIGYEVVTRIGPRVPRAYVGGVA
ncbi:MAG: alanine racemase [Candidatus Nanopelagicales bacterium]